MSNKSDISGTSKVQKKSVTYAKGYDDSNADMVLRSREGVLFRVHSYYLKATGGHYLSYIMTPKEIGAKDDPSAALDFLAPPPPSRPSSTMSHVRNPRSYLIGPRWSPFSAWASCMTSTSSPRLLVPSIELFHRSHPREIFAFASKHDFETLAKAAIGNFDNIGDVGVPVRKSAKRIKLESIDESYMEGVSAKYFTALIRAMRASEDSESYVDWTNAARVFEIKR